MKKLMIIAAALTLFTACKNGEETKNTTVVTTEETTAVDTVGEHVHVKTAVTETTKTDSTEATISTGGRKVEPVQEEPKN